MTNPSYKINNYKSIQMTFLIKSQKRLSKINFQIILKSNNQIFAKTWKIIKSNKNNQKWIIRK
jgi:hypothetical protein